MSDPYATWNPSRATDEPDEAPDRRIVPLIEELRAAGIVTFASCSGHPAVEGTARAGYLLMAADSMTDEQASALRADPAIWWVSHLPTPSSKNWHVAWLAEDFELAAHAIRNSMLAGRTTLSADPEVGEG